ncbi:MAG: hypothetical protein KDA61_14215, partial [Planctomycetales bacterium]|nr:hypothetical protein [Planctomycetales bacterium]
MKRILGATLLALLAPGLAVGASIIADDFESYADTTALGAVWNLGDGTLDAASGNPGQSLNHPGTGASFSGGNTNSRTFAPTVPAAGQTLRYSVDIFDDGSSANKRTTAGIRTAAGANILEMGMYNSPSYYAYRVVLFDTPAPGSGGWVSFSSMVDDLGGAISNTPVQGWHRFMVEITDSQAVFSLDLNSDGVINATATESIAFNATGGLDIIRLGGPSDL